MDKERRSRLWIVAIVIVGVIICLVLVAIFYSFQRTRSFNTRPLVMIHNPLNRDEIEVGDGVIIHATARSQRGVNHIELWVDNEKIAERDVTGTAASPLTLTKGWFPTFEGTHLITVVARSADGVEGQSSIGIIAVQGVTAHTVQEGKSLASIAEDYDTTPEEIEESNPDLGPGGPVPGDSLDIPGAGPGDAGDGEDPAPPESVEPPASESEDPPEAEPESPSDAGVVDEVVDWFGHPEEGLVGLQIEITSLVTTSGHPETLHCYVSFAGAPPIWYPDTDNDQSTDKSFEIDSISNLWDSEIWNVEDYLSGPGSTPVIFWPESEPLPLEIECVGTSGGGTEALDLGSLSLSIDSSGGMVHAILFRLMVPTEVLNSRTLSARLAIIRGAYPCTLIPR